MSRRISLTRIIAITWYGFRQIIDLADNVLISGAFGTGKSALLDLMQYVLLGGERQFNRAAAGNARGICRVRAGRLQLLADSDGFRRRSRQLSA